MRQLIAPGLMRVLGTLYVAAIVAAAAPSGVLSPGTDEATGAKELPGAAGCVSDPRCRSRLLQMRGRLLQSDSVAAAREFARDLSQLSSLGHARPTPHAGPDGRPPPTRGPGCERAGTGMIRRAAAGWYCGG